MVTAAKLASDKGAQISAKATSLAKTSVSDDYPVSGRTIPY